MEGGLEGLDAVEKGGEEGGVLVVVTVQLPAAMVRAMGRLWRRRLE